MRCRQIDANRCNARVARGLAAAASTGAALSRFAAAITWRAAAAAIDRIAEGFAAIRPVAVTIIITCDTRRTRSQTAFTGIQAFRTIAIITAYIAVFTRLAAAQELAISIDAAKSGQTIAIAVVIGCSFGAGFACVFACSVLTNLIFVTRSTDSTGTGRPRTTGIDGIRGTRNRAKCRQNHPYMYTLHCLLHLSFQRVQRHTLNPLYI